MIDILLALFCLRVLTQTAAAVKGQPAKKINVDYVGCFRVLLTMVFLQVTLNDGGNNSNWTIGLVISSFIIADGSAILLVYWDTQRASKPVLPFRNFMNRAMAASQLSFFFSRIAVAIVIYYVPIYLEVMYLV